MSIFFLLFPGNNRKALKCAHFSLIRQKMKLHSLTILRSDIDSIELDIGL